MKATISAHDAFHLLQYTRVQKKSYAGQMKDILINELGASKILCLADTTDVLIGDEDESRSLAIAIERNIDVPIEIIGSDYIDFRYLLENQQEWDVPFFGAHLPQKEHKPRREYLKVDNNNLEADLNDNNSFNVILSKNSLCCCDGKLTCGGVSYDKHSQKQYIKSLLTTNPDLMVLSATLMHFVDEEAEQQRDYQQARENLINACGQLKASTPEYGFEVIDTADYHIIDLKGDPHMETGYMLVVYKKNAVNFINRNESLHQYRLSIKNQESEDNASQPSESSVRDLSLFTKTSSVDLSAKNDKDGLTL